jgi:geranylgeranyl diphosphate synthase type II
MSASAAIALERHLEQRRARIDARLAAVLPRPPACPAVLDAALRYSLMAGGKRMRPVLTLMAAEAVAMSPDDVSLAEPAACAVELIHTYSLIHDDLPAMDNDTMRRGRPTSHVIFGDGLAILAGDGLLTEAFALLAREPESQRPEIERRKLRAIAALATAAGATGMVGGQAIDLAAARQVPVAAGGAIPELDARGLEDLHARKTGALIRAAAVAGAVMAGAATGQVEGIARYGAALGLAFQIVDDILDVRGDTRALGKTAGKDAAAGKVTYPALCGLEGAQRRAEEARDSAVAALVHAGLRNSDPLIALAHWVVARTR